MSHPADEQDTWHPARLIPTVGIRGQEEQERRATSSLLAVMFAVPDFGHALLKPLGAPKGRIRTFAEVRLKDADGKTHIPDGAIVVERGQKSWRCLVEVKTSRAELRSEQVSRYLDLARDQGFDAVLTISNAITGGIRESPLIVDKRKLRRVELFHLSWWRIVTEAIVQHRHRGVSDPDQAWLLGELIAYLDHEKSGAGGFEDMGEHWVAVRDGAAEGSLRSSDPTVRDVAARWEQFVEYVCLGLGQELGRDVRPVRSRGQDGAQRVESNGRALADGGTLEAMIRVPDAAGDIELTADLRAKRVTTRVSITASGDQRPLTRVNWLLRQLKDAPAGLLIETSFASTRSTTAVSLADARDDPRKALLADDPKRQPRSFRLSLSIVMGSKRGKGERSFVLETRKQTIAFYRDLVQDLRLWRAPAPKLPDAGDEELSEALPIPE